jgi:hypothetical protein
VILAKSVVCTRKKKKKKLKVIRGEIRLAAMNRIRRSKSFVEMPPPPQRKTCLNERSITFQRKRKKMEMNDRSFVRSTDGGNGLARTAALPSLSLSLSPTDQSSQRSDLASSRDGIHQYFFNFSIFLSFF